METTGDHIIIEMITDRDSLIDKALDRMKGFNIIHFMYYIVCSYLVFLQKYHRKFHVKTILITDRSVYKKVNGPFTIHLFNNFMYFRCMETQFEIKIPYEYLIRFWVTHTFNLEVFANFNGNNVNIANNRITIYLDMENKIPFYNSLKSHMMYHMKYNKIKLEVIDYYLSIKD